MRYKPCGSRVLEGLVMSNYYPFTAGMKNAWVRFRNGELLKWTAIYAAVAFGLSILSVILTFAVGIASSGGFTQFVRDNSNSHASPMVAVVRYGFDILIVLAGLYLIPRVLRASMTANKMKLPAKIPGMVDWAIFSIRRCLIDMFCWYDKKLLIPAVVLLVSGLLLFGAMIMSATPMILSSAGGRVTGNVLMGIFGIVLLVLAFLAYFIAYSIHSLRTHFSLYMYLKGDADGKASIRKSFDLVKGQTWQVFCAQLLYGVVIGLAAIVVMIVMFVLAIIPIVGILVDVVAFIALLYLAMAFNFVYMADVFAFFAKEGPLKITPAPDKKGITGSLAKKHTRK